MKLYSHKYVVKLESLLNANRNADWNNPCRKQFRNTYSTLKVFWAPCSEKLFYGKVQNLKICISNKFIGCADASGPGDQELLF